MVANDELLDSFRFFFFKQKTQYKTKHISLVYRDVVIYGIKITLQ